HDHEHEIHRWCRLLTWYDIPTDPTDLALRRPPPGGMPARVTVLHPGSKIAAKRWPAERFAALGRELTGRGHRVVVTGSADERALAERVARSAGLSDDAVLAGRTDLGDLAALVAYARLVVSGDTGVAHLATGYRTPSVVLFGPVSPARWGPPPGRPWHRVIWAATRDNPGWDGVGSHPTLAAVGVDEVLAAVDEVERAVRISGAVAA
ncbi:glycosyltransferase family 9 protein, partial [Micromonospora sp. LZ34]